jgi:hypothetical protein
LVRCCKSPRSMSHMDSEIPARDKGVGNCIAARTAALSLSTPVAKEEARLLLVSAIHGSSLSTSFFLIMAWNRSMRA